MPVPSATTERRLVALIGATLLVDSLFYTALTPLLGDFVHHLHMSTGAAGLLSAFYAIGTLAGALPAGLLVGRIGHRATVVTGLTLVTLSTAAFAVVDTPVLLDLARMLEGLGGAGAWAGGLSWLAEGTSPNRRGTVIGQALAAATAGSLLGPLVGALASAIGREIAFGAVAVLVATMVRACHRAPDAGVDSPASIRALARAAGDRRVLGTMWLITLPATISGAMSVLGSLRLHHLGAGAGIIGLTFLLAAAVQAVIGPLAGRASDTRGRLVPICLGLAAVSVLLTVFGLPRHVTLSAVVIIATLASVEGLWAPAMAWLSSILERRGDAAGLAGSLINLAWAGGQIAGGAGGGALAGATGDVLPMLIAAALALVTLLVLGVRARPGARLAGPGGPGDEDRVVASGA
jgi:MFS family permease